MVWRSLDRGPLRFARLAAADDGAACGSLYFAAREPDILELPVAHGAELLDRHALDAPGHVGNPGAPGEGQDPIAAPWQDPAAGEGRRADYRAHDHLLNRRALLLLRLPQSRRPRAPPRLGTVG